MGGRREGEGELGAARPEATGTRGDGPETAVSATNGEPRSGNEEAGETVRLDREQGSTEADRTSAVQRRPAVGWVDEHAMRLLGAFYDLSGGNATEEIPLGEPGESGRRGAVQEAGFDLDSTGGVVERDVAARYLQNMGYVQKVEEVGPVRFTVTPTGIEKVRRMRGLWVEEPEEKAEGDKMSEKTQTRLLSVLTIVLFIVLNGQVKKFIDKRVPERRGIRDDLLEASLQGVARLAAVFGASLVVKRLLGSSD